MEEIIQRAHIRVRESASSWEDAIRKAGRILVEAGSITQEYIDSMIEAVREYGPYIVISPNLALAHAAPGKSVLHTDISLITLSAPVSFGSVNDPVSIILCMGCTDQTSHLDRLSKIAELFSKEARINELAAAETVDDIISVLKGQ